MARRRGFTLFEVLTVVALVAVVFTLAGAPLFHVLRNLGDLEEEYGQKRALRMAAAAIAGDLREMLPATGDVLFRIASRERLGGVPDDAVLFRSAAPLLYGSPIGTIVYRVVRADIGSTALPGLYRWILPYVSANEVDPANLDPGRAQLVLPGVDSFRVAAYDRGKWVDSYAGRYPFALRVTIGRQEKSVTYEDWLPQL
jgi:prepilin-type N-terminal cleavage/methylation domain-containing protein